MKSFSVVATGANLKSIVGAIGALQDLESAKDEFDVKVKDATESAVAAKTALHGVFGGGGYIARHYPEIYEQWQKEQDDLDISEEVMADDGPPW